LAEKDSYFDSLDPANNVVHRLFDQLKTRGYDDAEASEIALAKATEHGNFDRGSMDLTAQGRERSRMGAAGRAIDRAATSSGHAESAYRYNPKTNRATLKSPKTGFNRKGGSRGRIY
jgi:hypothetical protein